MLEVLTVVSLILAIIASLIAILPTIWSRLPAHRASASQKGTDGPVGSPSSSAAPLGSPYPRYPMLAFGSLIVISLELAMILGFGPFTGIFLQSLGPFVSLYNPEGAFIVIIAMFLAGFFFFWIWLIALANAWALRLRVWLSGMITGGIVAATALVIVLLQASTRTFGLPTITSIAAAALGQYVWYFAALIFSIFGPTQPSASSPPK